MIGDDEFDEFDDEVEEHHDWLQAPTAFKFLMAGGFAGAGTQL